MESQPGWDGGVRPPLQSTCGGRRARGDQGTQRGGASVRGSGELCDLGTSALQLPSSHGEEAMAPPVYS